MPNRFIAACIQSDVHVVNELDPDCDVEATIQKNLGRNMQLVDYLAGESRYNGPKLMVFSEFCLTGVPETRAIEHYRSRAVTLPGWVTEVIAERTRKYGIHVVMNTFERDEEWPGLVFNTTFMVDPKGDVILRYRKNNNAQSGVPKNINPGDIYSRYTTRYGGPESLFPVVDTEIGRIGAMTCFDMRFAEVPRMLALQGAEIICHPTAEGGPGSASVWQLAKQVRAWDNSVYLLSCTNAHTIGSLRPHDQQTNGKSRIIDFEGKILQECEAGEKVITATIDLDLLREHRATINRDALSQSRFETYVPLYQKYATWPLDMFDDTLYETAEQMAAIRNQVREKLYAQGRWAKARPRMDA